MSQHATAIREQLALLSHAQQDRLAFIDFSLQYFGQITRNDLIQRFRTGLAASTRDFATYKELVPDNMQLVHQTKSYHRCAAFKPLFQHNPEVILASLSRGFGNGMSSGTQPSEHCFDAVRLIHPNAEIIAGLMRAIHNKQALKCQYVSITSGDTERAIVPHSIVNNGHRWHVRAYDRKRNCFRDFVCSRFTHLQALSGPVHVHEASPYDEQWQRLVKLVLIPHPGLKQPKAIEMDYAMTDGQLCIHVRAAIAAYVLRQWQVDCSADRSCLQLGCQLALANLSILDEIENVGLTIGSKR
jgi:hypothetical protein